MPLPEYLLSGFARDVFLSYQLVGYLGWLKDPYFYSQQSPQYICKGMDKKRAKKHPSCRNLLGEGPRHISIASFLARLFFVQQVSKEHDTVQEEQGFHGLKSKIYGSRKAVCCVRAADFAVSEGQK
jgi:hypothetical protein